MLGWVKDSFGRYHPAVAAVDIDGDQINDFEWAEAFIVHQPEGMFYADRAVVERLH